MTQTRRSLEQAEQTAQEALQHARDAARAFEVAEREIQEREGLQQEPTRQQPLQMEEPEREQLDPQHEAHDEAQDGSSF